MSLDLRVPMMMSRDEVRDIDDWMFAHRLRSRSEAIRQLVKLGLQQSTAGRRPFLDAAGNVVADPDAGWDIQK